MSLPQSSKHKSTRTWWGYHSRPAGRERWLKRGWTFAFLLGLGILPLWWVPSRTGSSPVLEVWASPGPVADVHRAWNHDCETCHEPYRPMKANREVATIVGETVTDDWRTHASNIRCQSCHTGAAHHSNQRGSDAGHCADCHMDHQGLDNSLVRLDDEQCTRCHADLRQHAINEALLTSAQLSITDFATAHPEFSPLRSNSQNEGGQPHHRGLKFSHAVHMMPGMGLKRVGATGQALQDGGPYTLKQIQEPYRSLYATQGKVVDLNAVVQLACHHCHELDAMREEGQKPLVEDVSHLPVETVDPPRGDGSYYLPIVYEKHCQGCHPLGFDAEQPQVTLDHGLQPAEVHERVLEHFSARFLNEKLQERFRRPTNLRLDPQSDELSDADRADIMRAAREATAKSEADLYQLLSAVSPAAQEQIDQASVALFVGRKTCGECHSLEGDVLSAKGPAKVAAVNIPTIWQTKARFDHLSHQGLSCASCHPQSSSRDLAAERKRAREYAGPTTVDAIYQHPPDLPDLASCRSCHSPRRREQDHHLLGGVSARCTDCHMYHNVEHGLQGRGARALSPAKQTSSFHEFLNPVRRGRRQD